MSTFKIDFITPQSDIFQYREDTTIKAMPHKSLPKIEIGEFLDALVKFARSLYDEDYEKYSLARVASKTTKNNKDSIHIWNIFTQFFIQSLTLTYPDKDFSEFKKQIKDIDISFLEKEDVDNRVFTMYLIGIFEGLL
jgi:hypothetical protein